MGVTTDEYGVEIGVTADEYGVLLVGLAVTVTVTGVGTEPGAVTVDLIVWVTVSISGAAELDNSPPTLTIS